MRPGLPAGIAAGVPDRARTRAAAASVRLRDRARCRAPDTPDPCRPFREGFRYGIGQPACRGPWSANRVKYSRNAAAAAGAATLPDLQLQLIEDLLQLFDRADEHR